MEEQQLQDPDELLQELQKESGAQESLPQEVEDLLRVLHSGKPYLARQDAAEQLGRVRTSSPRIIRALTISSESDSYSEVRRSAAQSFRAPVHQGYLQQHPDLREAAGNALRQEVSGLLRFLQSSPNYLARETAAERLGNVETSNPRILRALIAACESDTYPEVRRAAATALRSPVHQDFVQQHPDLMEATEQALRQEITLLLRILHSGRDVHARQVAAELLGNVEASSPRIVRALNAACESDPHAQVRKAAAKSVCAPVHQKYLQQHPDLLEADEIAPQQPPGAVEELPGLGSSRVRTYQGVEGSPLLGVFHDHRWKWAPIYGIALAVATSLVFAVFAGWTFVVAGVVWFAGAALGLAILEQKGYPAVGLAFGSLDFLGNLIPLGALVLLALIVLAGPVILLVALFVRPRESPVRISKRRAEARDPGHSKSSPASRDQGSGCTSCGAWNTPGRECCDECGAALTSAQA